MRWDWGEGRVPASARTTDWGRARIDSERRTQCRTAPTELGRVEGTGDGSPHPRDNGWGRDGFPPPSSLGQAPRGNDGLGARMGGGGRGWVPASARTTDGALRRGPGDGFPPPSSLGQALRGNNGSGCGNDGLGARMGGGGRGWVPASARTTDGEGMDSRPRLHGVGSTRE